MKRKITVTLVYDLEGTDVDIYLAQKDIIQKIEEVHKLGPLSGYFPKMGYEMVKDEKKEQREGI